MQLVKCAEIQFLLSERTVSLPEQLFLLLKTGVQNTVLM